MTFNSGDQPSPYNTNVTSSHGPVAPLEHINWKLANLEMAPMYGHRTCDRGTSASGYAQLMPAVTVVSVQGFLATAAKHLARVISFNSIK